MKKLAISALLLLLCNNAMSSDWRSFGSNPKEEEFLSGLESYVLKYAQENYNPGALDDCVENLLECVVDQIWLFENGRYGKDPFPISSEMYDFLDELLDNVSKLEDRCCALNPEIDYSEIEKLAKEWSAHTLLEKWRQEREANGGRKVEKQVHRRYKSYFGQK